MRLLLVSLFLVFSYQTLASELIYEARKKNIELTDKDVAILETGEISTTRYIIGGVIGTYPIGLGLGHAIQGRWSEQGYIYTWGQLGSLAAIVLGAGSCIDGDNWECTGAEQALITIGVISYVGLRLWEIVDVWAAPPSHNLKHRNLKKYIDEGKVEPKVKASLDLVPIINPRMGQGLGLNYVF